jgi:hypothetical protein
VHVNNLYNLDEEQNWVVAFEKEEKNESQEDPSDNQSGISNFMSDDNNVLTHNCLLLELLFKCINSQNVSCSVFDCSWLEAYG